MGSIVIGVIVAIVVIILLAMSIRIVQEYERGVIFRLGRLLGLKDRVFHDYSLLR